MSNYILTSTGELYHYGTKGMKWGVRRYQNKDGSLTAAGKKREKDDYSKRIYRGHAGPGKYITKNRQLARDRRDLKELNQGKHLSYGIGKKRQAAYDARDRARLEKRIAKNENKLENNTSNEKLKKAIKIGAIVAGTALAAYGTYKMAKFIKDKNVQIAAKRGEAAAKAYFNEHKITLRSGSFAGHINTYTGGTFNGRTSRPVTNVELRSMANKAYETNIKTLNAATGIKNQYIRDAQKSTFTEAAKNVGKYYIDKRKKG